MEYKDYRIKLTLSDIILKIIFSFIILSSSSAQLFAQRSIFRNHSTSEGLVHNFVYIITEDKEGFIWVGTSNGLSRFDGHSFKNYIHSEVDTSSLNGSAVMGIAEGKDGKLWLSTDGGIEYFDKKTGHFSELDLPSLKGQFFHKDIYLNDKEQLWIRNRSLGFVCIDTKTGTIARQIDSIIDPATNKRLKIIHFLADGNVLWLACKNGKAYYDLESDQLHFIDTNTIVHSHSIQKVSDSTIIVTDMHDGLYFIDTQSKTGRWIKKTEIEKRINAKVSLFGANYTADGTLWVSTSPGLVAIKGDETVYHNSNSKQHYFGGNVVSYLFRDQDDNLWVGSYDNGIFLTEKGNNRFHYATELHKDDIQKTYISNISLFDDGSILYADGKGIYRCKNYKNLYVGCAKRIMSSRAANLFQLDNRYAMLCDKDTLYLYDSKTQSASLSHIVQSPACMHLANDGVIWAGTWGGKVQGYDPSSKQYYNFLINTKTAAAHVTAIKADKDGSLWLGVFGSGLVHVHNPKSETRSFEFYNKNQTGDHYLNILAVNTLFIDNEDNLWIGTNGGGMVLRDNKSKKLSVFNSENGLKSDVIKAILADDHGNIWFTSNVLSKYNTQSSKLTHFSHADGINGNFMGKACAKSASGDLLFASTDGLYYFDPILTAITKKAKEPLFTEIRINGITARAGDSIEGQVPLHQEINYCQKIELPYYLNSIVLDFTSIDYHESQLLQYQYKLSGVEKEWVRANAKNRSASYAGLQPGSYSFAVRASYDAETWSSPRHLEIEVLPPWWKTTLFKVSVGIGLSLIIFLFIWWKLRSIMYEKHKLEQLVDKRTAELKDANEKLSTNASILHTHVENLKESKLVIEMKNDELTETLGMKDRLISIIGHDFKNSLIGIRGIIAVFKMTDLDSDPEKLAQLIDSLDISSKKLSDQMLNVLEWAQASLQKMNFKPQEINLESLIIDTIQLTQVSAKQKGIRIDTQLDYEYNALADPRMTSTIFRNLLNNAIKFTHKGGNIIITLTEDETMHEVSIVDTGIGMSEEKQNAIFNEYDPENIEYGTNNEKGTGLGLQICKSFVEKNGGSISVKSEIGKGSVFTVLLPKGKSLASAAKLKKQNIKIELPQTPDHNKRSTILLIDDNEQIVEMLNSIYSKDYNIIKAYDGKAGLYLAQNMLPNIIISDINMPKLSGLELCHEIKNGAYQPYTGDTYFFRKQR